MPFKSEEQRRYMHANLPEIAQRWEQEYSNGGIMRLPFRHGGDTMGGRNDRSNQGPAGGASAGGDYGGNSSGGVGPNQMSGAGSSTRDRPNPHTISGTSKATFVDPGRISTSPQFTQEGRDTLIQNLAGPTLGQRIGQGIGTFASGVGDYISSGGMWGAAARGLNSLFGPKSSPRELGIMNQYLGPKGSTLSIGRNDIPMSREGHDTPLWQQLGYPSYEAWVASQNQGIAGIEDIIDDTETDDFVWRFAGNQPEDVVERIEEQYKDYYTV